VLIGLLLALGCSVCYGTATVLQAAATRSVDAGDSDSGVDAALLLRALRQWRYLLGIALDGLGFLLQIAALRLVPIYLVAAAIAASLAVTAIVAAWLLHTRLSGMEWAAVAVVCASLAMLGIAAGPEGDGHGPPGLGWALLVIVAVIFVAGATAGRLGDRTRALVLGFGAGAGFGVDEIAVRLIDSLDLTEASFWTNPAVYALVAGGAAGFLLLTNALSRGSVTTAVAGMVIGETVGPALVGVAWLGDRTRPGLGWMVEVGFAVAVLAALALSRFGEAPEAAES
jgi:drug/metabolite transporter (DMT)-like permease